MISERLKQLVELKGISSRAFALNIGVSSQVFGKYLKDREPSYDTLRRIIETYDDISADWLLTGKGEMLKKNAEESQITEDNSRLWALIESQIRTIESQQRTIEAFAQKGAAGGVLGVASTGVGK